MKEKLCFLKCSALFFFYPLPDLITDVRHWGRCNRYTIAMITVNVGCSCCEIEASCGLFGLTVYKNTRWDSSCQRLGFADNTFQISDIWKRISLCPSNPERERLNRHPAESLPLCGAVRCTDGRNLPQIKRCLCREALVFQLALPPIHHFQDTSMHDVCKLIKEAGCTKRGRYVTTIYWQFSN